MGWFSSKPEPSPGRTQSWWNRTARAETVNPNRIKLRSGTINRRDVERYKRNPNARATGGDKVYVVRRADGTLFAREGAHRITAARETGRRIRIHVVDERRERRG
jgi:hypothetical protein